ncbi:MAG: hypothetical protein LH645_06750 [Actinomycetia bacterium]|nr:hypothetical protein [Actinomycetes bacterium]
MREHDFDTLTGLCDDDFGIVDIAPDGSGVPIRTRAGWEAWFCGGHLDADRDGLERVSLALLGHRVRHPFGNGRELSKRGHVLEELDPRLTTKSCAS